MFSTINEIKNINVEQRKKYGFLITYSIAQLGNSLYALPIHSDFEPKLLIHGIKDTTYTPNGYAILSENNEVCVEGISNTLQLDDAFMISSYNDELMITGRSTITFWNCTTGRTKTLKYDNKITSGRYIYRDIVAIVIDGNLHIAVAQSKNSKIISSEGIAYYKIMKNLIMTTTQGFVYKGLHFDLGITPQRVETNHESAIALVNGNICIFSVNTTSNSKNFNMNYFEDNTIDDICWTYEKLFGLSGNEVFLIELTNNSHKHLQ